MEVRAASIVKNDKIAWYLYCQYPLVITLIHLNVSILKLTEGGTEDLLITLVL
jgi:hypothetical protein